MTTLFTVVITACGDGGSTTALTEEATLNKANTLLKSATASGLLPKDCNVSLSDKSNKPEQSSEFIISCGDGTTFVLAINFSTDGTGKEDNALRQGKDGTLKITLSDSSVFDNPLVQKWAQEMIADANKNKTQSTVYGCNIDVANSLVNCTGQNLEGATVKSGGGSSLLQEGDTGEYSAAVIGNSDPLKLEPVQITVLGKDGKVSDALTVATIEARDKDTDADGVIDSLDTKCPTTPAGKKVYPAGNTHAGCIIPSANGEFGDRETDESGNGIINKAEITELVTDPDGLIKGWTATGAGISSDSYLYNVNTPIFQVHIATPDGTLRAYSLEGNDENGRMLIGIDGRVQTKKPSCTTIQVRVGTDPLGNPIYENQSTCM